MLCVQDFFSSSVAPVKKVILNYGPNGRSRGSATVHFGRPTAAAEAVKYDGTKVDGRSMRVSLAQDRHSHRDVLTLTADRGHHGSQEPPSSQATEVSRRASVSATHIDRPMQS